MTTSGGSGGSGGSSGGTELFAPVCSITMTKRRRFFWAAWWSVSPTRIPFKKPDASDGGASTFEEALVAAQKRAPASLTVIDPLWARAWIRILRGEEAWPSKASREPRAAAPPTTTLTTTDETSIWSVLGVTRDATATELKAAYRQRALEAHPDHGGDDVSFRRLQTAYEEAKRRIRRPKPKLLKKQTAR